MGLFIGPHSRECGTCHVVKPFDRFSPRGQRGATTLYKSVCKDCCASQARDWYSRNTEQGLTNRRRLQIKAAYGITPEQYDEMLAAQEGLCAICRQPETTINYRSKRPFMRLSVDHCHDTGRIRGLLCHRCNRSIGLLGDDIDLLRKAIDYLERGSGSH